MIPWERGKNLVSFTFSGKICEKKVDPWDGVVKERIGQERSHREVIERGDSPALLWLIDISNRYLGNHWKIEISKFSWSIVFYVETLVFRVPAKMRWWVLSQMFDLSTSAESFCFILQKKGNLGETVLHQKQFQQTVSSCNAKIWWLGLE